MNQPFVTEDAETDLRDIWSYIARDSESQADRWVAMLRKKCYDLAEFPELGPARPDLADALRYFPFRDDLIFYRPIPGGVEIIRILHGSRNVEGEFHP